MHAKRMAKMASLTWLFTLAAPFFAAGCFVNEYSADPNTRLETLLADAGKAPPSGPANTPAPVPKVRAAADAVPSAPGRSEIVPDLDLVPADVLWLVTCRPAGLVKTFASSGPLKMDADGLCKQTLGIPVRDVERCWVFMTARDKELACVIVRTARPYARDKVLKACVSDAREHNLPGGKKIFVNPHTGTAVRFVDERVLFVARGEEVLARCQALSEETKKEPRAFAKYMGTADRHDVAAWCRVSGGMADGALPGPLKSVRSASVSVDVGKEVTVALLFHCDGENEAASVHRVVRAYRDMFRGQVLVLAAMRELAKSFPEAQDFNTTNADATAWPVKLLRQTGDALEHAVQKAEGSTVSATISMPVEAVNWVMERLGQEGVMPGFPLGFQTWRSGMTLPAGKYLNHPPQYIQSSPPFPLSRELAQQEVSTPLQANPGGQSGAKPSPTSPQVPTQAGNVGSPFTPPATSTGALPAPTTSTPPALAPSGGVVQASLRPPKDTPAGSAQVKTTELEDFVLKSDGMAFNNFCLAEKADETAAGRAGLEVSGCYRNPGADRAGYCLMIVGMDEGRNVLWACNVAGAAEGRSVGVLRETVHLLVPAGTLKQTAVCSVRAVVAKVPVPAAPVAPVPTPVR